MHSDSVSCVSDDQRPNLPHTKRHQRTFYSVTDSGGFESMNEYPQKPTNQCLDSIISTSPINPTSYIPTYAATIATQRSSIDTCTKQEGKVVDGCMQRRKHQGFSDWYKQHFHFHCCLIFITVIQWYHCSFSTLSQEQQEQFQLS